MYSILNPFSIIKNQNMKPLQKKSVNPKPVFNKIQSWLQEMEQIENTQRMLLRGGSGMLEGSKLKSKNRIGSKRTVPYNFIEINNQKTVFKIASFQEDDPLTSKALASFKKQFNIKGSSAIRSETASPRYRKSLELSKNTSISRLRQPLPLNKRQFLFKLKRVTRVQSCVIQNKRPMSNNKNKPQKSRENYQYNQIIKGIDGNFKNQQLREQSPRKRKFKTSPSTPKNIQSPMSKLNQQKLQINSVCKEKLQQKSIKRNDSVDVTNKNLRQEVGRNLIQVNIKPKIDPRIRLEIQIAQKLFHMQHFNKKAHLIHTKIKQNEK